MNEKNSYFRQFDQYIFTQLDQFKKTPAYQNILDLFQGIDEEQQKVLKFVLTIFIIALPFLVIFIFLRMNAQLYSELELRKNIISRAQEIIRQQKQTESLTNSLVSTQLAYTQEDFTSLIINNLNGTGIDLAKFKVTSFSSEALGTSLNRAEGNLQFNSLSTDQLMTLFINLINRGKMKVAGMKITRNEESTLLEGQIQLIQFGQSLSEEE